MLPDWMIEELEQERRRGERSDRPRLELELPHPEPQAPGRRDGTDVVERGVVTLQIL
jgi:hypothetical protein